MSLETVEQALREIPLPEAPRSLKGRIQEAVQSRSETLLRSASPHGPSKKPHHRWNIAIATAAAFLFGMILLIVVTHEPVTHVPGPSQDSLQHWGHLGKNEALWISHAGIDDVLKSQPRPEYVTKLMASPLRLDFVEATLKDDRVTKTALTSLYQDKGDEGKLMTVLLRGVIFEAEDVEGAYSSEDSLSYQEIPDPIKARNEGLFYSYKDARSASLLLIASSMEGAKPIPGKALFQALLRASRHSRKDIRAVAAHALRHYRKRPQSVTTTITLLADNEESVVDAARGTLKASLGITGGSAEELRAWWNKFSPDSQARLLKAHELGDFEEVPLELRQRLK